MCLTSISFTALLFNVAMGLRCCWATQHEILRTTTTNAALHRKSTARIGKLNCTYPFMTANSGTQTFLASITNSLSRNSSRFHVNLSSSHSCKCAGLFSEKVERGLLRAVVIFVYIKEMCKSPSLILDRFSKRKGKVNLTPSLKERRQWESRSWRHCFRLKISRLTCCRWLWRCFLFMNLLSKHPDSWGIKSGSCFSRKWVCDRLHSHHFQQLSRSINLSPVTLSGIIGAALLFHSLSRRDMCGDERLHSKEICLSTMPQTQKWKNKKVLSGGTLRFCVGVFAKDEECDTHQNKKSSCCQYLTSHILKLK